MNYMTATRRLLAAIVFASAGAAYPNHPLAAAPAARAATTHAVGGAGRFIAPAQRTVVHRFRFAAGRLVSLTVVGDGDTDLDFVLRGPDGRVLLSDVDGTDYTRFVFVATRGGEYTLEVRNLGPVYNEYVLELDTD
jgi:hypothetical protein